MKVYKGTDKDMKCRGKQYEIGVEATEERAELCERGIHACEYPLYVFRYYPPGNGSRYFVGDLEGTAEKREPDKVVGTKLMLNAEVGIPGLVKAAVEYIKERVDRENIKESNTGDYSAATNTGDRSAAEVTGKESVAIALGIEGRAKGALGCWLVLAEWALDEESGEWRRIAVRSAMVDGTAILENTWYMLVEGEFKKVEGGAGA